MTRHERHTSVSCLFVRGGLPGLDPREPYRRIGHLLHVATYARTELDNKCESRCAKIVNPEWTHVLVLFNPVAERRSPKYATEFEDNAIEELIRIASTNNELLPRNDFDGNIKLVGYSRTSVEAWSILEALLRIDAYLELRSRYLDVANRALCPFPVIKDLGGFSLAATTQLVWFAGQHAVCKCFRAGFESHYHREKEALYIADSIGVGPKVFEVGDTYVVMEFLEDYRTVQTNLFGLYPQTISRSIFSALKEMHLAGFACFDFSPSNVLVKASGSVKLIDFENYFRYEGPVPEFTEAPVFTWRRFFDSYSVDSQHDDDMIQRYRDKGPTATYGASWKPHIGLSIDELMNPGTRSGWKRMRHLLTQKIPRYAMQKVARAQSM